MDYALVAFLALCFGAIVGHVLTQRQNARRLLREEPTEPDPELRLVDIQETKQELYRRIDALDAEEGFILETWGAGSQPVPQYLEYAIEKPTS